jgi:pre-mRNA branch site protein p14
MSRSAPTRLPPEVNRVLYVKNLPYKITAEEIYTIFGRFGALRQVRVGDTPATKGTAFIVYEDILDARQACEHLSGFAVGGRYLILHYYAPAKGEAAPVDLAAEEAAVAQLRARVAANEAAAEDEGGGALDDDEAERKRLVRQRG